MLSLLVIIQYIAHGIEGILAVLSLKYWNKFKHLKGLKYFPLYILVSFFLEIYSQLSMGFVSWFSQIPTNINISLSIFYYLYLFYCNLKQKKLVIIFIIIAAVSLIYESFRFGNLTERINTTHYGMGYLLILVLSFIQLLELLKTYSPGTLRRKLIFWISLGLFLNSGFDIIIFCLKNVFIIIKETEHPFLYYITYFRILITIVMYSIFSYGIIICQKKSK